MANKIVYGSDFKSEKDMKFKSAPSGINLNNGGFKQASFQKVEHYKYDKLPQAEGEFTTQAAVGRALFAEALKSNFDKANAVAKNFGIDLNNNASAQKTLKSMRESITGRFNGSLSEDLNTTNSDSLYVKFLHQTVYGDIALDIEPYMKLVNVNEDLLGKNGFGSVKIPKIYPGIATVLGEDGEIIYFGDNTTDIEITPTVKALGTKITFQLMKRGLDGVVKIMLRFAANGLGRKIGYDIVNTLAAGATGSVTIDTNITYDDIVDARAKVNSAKYSGVPYGFVADKLVIDTLQFSSLQKSVDYKNHVFRATILPGEKYATIDRLVQYFGDLLIVETNLLDSSIAAGFVEDSRFAGIFVKETNYITFERDLPNTFGTKEIVLGMSYGVGVLFGAAIAKMA